MTNKIAEVEALRAGLENQRLVTAQLEASIRCLPLSQRQNQEFEEFKVDMARKAADVEILKAKFDEQRMMAAKLETSAMGLPLNKPSAVEIENLKVAVAQKALELDRLKYGMDTQAQSIRQLELSMASLKSDVKGAHAHQRHDGGTANDQQQKAGIEFTEEKLQGLAAGLDALDRKVTQARAESKDAQERTHAAEKAMRDLRAEAQAFRESQAKILELEERMSQLASSAESGRQATEGLRSGPSQSEAATSSNAVGADVIRHLQRTFSESIHALEGKVEAREWDMLALEAKLSSVAGGEMASTVEIQGQMVDEASEAIRDIQEQLGRMEERVQQAIERSGGAMAPSQEHAESLIHAVNEIGQSHSEGLRDCRERLRNVEGHVRKMRGCEAGVHMAGCGLEPRIHSIQETVEACMKQVQELKESRGADLKDMRMTASELTSRIWDLRAQLQKINRLLPLAGSLDGIEPGGVESPSSAMRPISKRLSRKSSKQKITRKKSSLSSEVDLSRCSSLGVQEVAEGEDKSRPSSSHKTCGQGIEKQRSSGGTRLSTAASAVSLGSQRLSGRPSSVKDSHQHMGSTLDDHTDVRRSNSVALPSVSFESSVISEALQVADRLSRRCTADRQFSYPALRSPSHGSSVMGDAVAGPQELSEEPQPHGRDSGLPGSPKMSIMYPAFSEGGVVQHGSPSGNRLKGTDEGMGSGARQWPGARARSGLTTMSSNPVFACGNGERASDSVASEFSD
eukprot:evm.model.scf_884EXC.4 EVM.evm.TU.scf_884EXC.4   scf_884EXC:27993-30668(-)